MKNSSLFAILCLSIALTGCGGVSEKLGLGRNPPDEFAVVDRPPLSLPPDFSLRPPKPGAPRPQEIDMTDRANNVLFGGESKTASSSDKSNLELALLESANAAKAEPNIRETVDREAHEKVVASKRLIDDLLFWRKPEVPATTVDAAAERERIKAAKEEGTPLNKGGTPVIERKKRSFLGL